MNLQDTIKDFNQRISHIAALNNAISLIHWDGATGAPDKGIDYRSRNIGILSTDVFNRSILNPEFKELIDTLTEHMDELDEVTATNVKIYGEEIEKNQRIPAEDYRRFMELRTKAEHVWAEAREKSDYELFKPYLSELIDFTRQFIELRDPVPGHPYNALLDDYEKGMTVEDLDKFFGELKVAIVPLLERITKEGKKIPADLISGSFEPKLQEDYSFYLLDLIDFDLDAGMLKESAHPFTIGIDLDDVRITTHYYEDLPMSSMFSSLHEGGHGIYEQNIDRKFAGTAACTGTSMGIHESQSRFYENVLGRNKNFWAFAYPKLQETFPTQLNDTSLDDFYLAINEAKASLIRVEADELTYALHIMIRYELEKALIDGSLTVDELPARWNDKYEEYLGIRPANDAEGVLQDIHWADALFGYFPSYALGNAYAAQFTHVMSKELDLDQLMKEGNLQPIKKWLNEKIHCYGKSLTPKEILEKVTGEGLNPKYLIDYLTEKYTTIFFD